MVLYTCSHYFSFEYIECGKQCCCPIPFVIMRDGLLVTPGKGQWSLCSIKCLYLCLLIYRQY